VWLCCDDMSYQTIRRSGWHTVWLQPPCCCHTPPDLCEASVCWGWGLRSCRPVLLMALPQCQGRGIRTVVRVNKKTARFGVVGLGMLGAGRLVRSSHYHCQAVAHTTAAGERLAPKQIFDLKAELASALCCSVFLQHHAAGQLANNQPQQSTFHC